MVKKKGKVKKNLKLFLPVGILFVVCVTTVGTLSWLVVERQNSGNVDSIIVEEGITLNKVYGFQGNYRLTESGKNLTVGYTPDPNYDLNSYDVFANENSIGTPLFIDITDSITDGLLGKAENLKPDTKFAFAFVVTTNTKIERSLLLSLMSYSCGYNYDETTMSYPQTRDENGNLRNIYLSEAIRMTAHTYLFDDTNNLNYGKNFIIGQYVDGDTTSSLTNGFNSSQGGDNIKCNIPLSSCEVKTGDVYKYLMFFSIEFSDDSSTYYSRNNGEEVYTKDPNGNSNVYSDGYFDIGQLSIWYNNK